MLNTAIIGISGWGRIHYEDLLRRRERGDIRICAATVINQAEEAEKCAFLQSIGCRIFDSHQAMLSEFGGKLDLCFIPTGIDLHAPMAIEAMRAGANAFIEKPAAAVIEDIAAMQAVERETGKHVWVGFQIACQPEVRRMRALCHSPEFGAIRRIRGIGLAPRTDSYYRRNLWAGKLRKNGAWILDSPYNNALAHYLHLALLFAAAPGEIPEFRSVKAQLFRVNPNLECADNGCILAVSGQGIPVSFHASHTPEKLNDLRIVIDGEHGSVEWTFPGTTYRIGEECVTLTNTGGTELRDLMLDALFARCTGRMQGDCCDLECAAVHTRVVNAAHDSSPVTEVPAGYVEEYRDEELRWGLKGFDGECSAAWREGRLLSRRVYPWLPEPAEVFLEGYRRFGGSLLRQAPVTGSLSAGREGNAGRIAAPCA
ncbi:Gfo/Idh/MocA family protein [Victivallis vadensis]|uniref:Gfo/Idh/MocA family protein n=1 Tax=Victivallis vadensis TaxID=172901 RepID=UPI003AF6C4EB